MEGKGTFRHPTILGNTVKLIFNKKENKQAISGISKPFFSYCMHLRSTVSHLVCITHFLWPTNTVFLKLSLTLIVKA